MALQLGALRDALMHPGDVERADKAAEEVADYQRQIADIRSDLTVLKWMVGTLIVLQTTFGFGTVWMLLNVMSRLPR